MVRQVEMANNLPLNREEQCRAGRMTAWPRLAEDCHCARKKKQEKEQDRPGQHHREDDLAQRDAPGRGLSLEVGRQRRNGRVHVAGG